ncbi:MAG: vgb 3 [Verrucomicrobia bacterium]|jgi:DNA-binding beta-propeller fold protein YncE|nr:vgb 3 [Verrucomicrobiota bacterium]
MTTRLSRLLFVGVLSVSSLVAQAAQLVLVAGGTNDAVNIPAIEAKLKEPFGTEFDAAGNMYIVEMASGNRLLRVDGKGVLTHVAGKPQAGDSGDGGWALNAKFNGPHNLAILPDGNVLIGDTWNGRVRKVDVKANKVSSIEGFNVPNQKAKSLGPYCISLDFSGTQLYIADLRQVHVLDLKTGKSKVVAGNGQKGVPTDGAVATEAPLVDPRAAAADRLGNVYILERGGNALRVVDKDGKIKTVVNASGKKGGTGDGGPGLEATMNGPKYICIDRDNSVIIADAESHLVRRYQPKDGKITRIAGTGVKGAEGLGGDPTKAQLARPHGVTVHPKTGELYITDSYNDRILKIVP